ncbi:MAG: ABC transmembrane type-1 domain-containing protein [Xylanivirga thermophila]|jgi:putative aldouronate transport system permease protein|uniref:ABC transporter permease n=1 Tax=Xylanivirga thermophila TaxID=2496273 RepID=UPI0039F49DBA
MANSTEYSGITTKNKKSTKFKSQLYLQIFAIMGIAFIILFSYTTMVGIIIAFKQYSITTGIKGFFTSPWVGLKHFKRFVRGVHFWEVTWNTIILSSLKLLFGFPLPIILALMINSVKNEKFKRVVQTVSYLPHFMSWIVVWGLLFAFLNGQNGLINVFLVKTGLRDTPVSFLSDPSWFRPIAVISELWKEMGWNSIIYLAAIAGIDPSLYEAAIIDGSNRLQRTWYITLPSIRDTAVLLLILAISGLFSGGLEQSLLLGNAVNAPVSNIISKYSFEQGLVGGRYSFATAIGLFQSVIAFALLLLSNYIAKKVTDTSLF